jgi:hypothetical protein
VQTFISTPRSRGSIRSSIDRLAAKQSSHLLASLSLAVSVSSAMPNHPHTRIHTLSRRARPVCRYWLAIRIMELQSDHGALRGP